MNRKDLSHLFVLALLLLALVACRDTTNVEPDEETGEAATPEEYTVAVFIPNGGDGYFQNKSYGYIQGANLLEATHEGLQVNAELYDAGGYDQSEEQISQVEDAIQRGVDAIIITATDRQALAPVVDRAMAQGIPVINDDVLVATETTTSISENSCRVGRNAAEYIARSLNNQGNVVMLKGAAGGQLFQDRAQCAHEEFDRYSEMQVVDEQWHQLNIVEGRRIMEDFIQAHGVENIDAVWATNSTVGIGAAEALRSAGAEAGDVLIIAIDFHDEALSYMEDGWIAGLIPAQPVKLASLAMRYAVEAAQGQEVPERIYTTDDMVVDAEMLPTFDTADAMAPDGWQPPLR